MVPILGPIVYSIMCGIFGAAFFSMGGIFTLTSPAFLYLAGMRAGILGSIISSIPTFIFITSLPHHTNIALSYILFAFMPMILWIGLLRFRTLEQLMIEISGSLQSKNFGFGQPKMIFLYISVLLCVYVIALCLPDVQTYCAQIYRYLTSNIIIFFHSHGDLATDVTNDLAILKAQKMLPTEDKKKLNDVLQMIPGNFALLLLGVHWTCWKMALKIISYLKGPSPWKPHPLDNDYPMWGDLLFLTCLTLQYVTHMLNMPPWVQFVSLFFLTLSGLPLLYLGMRILRIWAQKRGFKDKTVKIALVFLFLLGFPIMIVILLGFIESIFNISQRLDLGHR